MSTIDGVFITPADGRWLSNRLRRVGRADDVLLANRIDTAIAYDLHVVLDDPEREIVIDSLCAVELPPQLEQLRALLG